MCGKCCGKFMVGAAMGMVAGAALSMSMMPSRCKLKKTVQQATKRMTEAVESFADAIDM